MLNEKNLISLEDLEKYPLILFHPIDISESILSNENQINRTTNEIYYCDYPSEALMLALSGMGIAIMPEILIPDFISISRKALSVGTKVSYGIYYHPKNHSDILQDFLDVARKTLNEKDKD